MRTSYRLCGVEAVGRAEKPLASNPSRHLKAKICCARHPHRTSLSIKLLFISGFLQRIPDIVPPAAPVGLGTKYLPTYKASTVPRVEHEILFMKPMVTASIWLLWQIRRHDWVKIYPKEENPDRSRREKNGRIARPCRSFRAKHTHPAATSSGASSGQDRSARATRSRAARRRWGWGWRGSRRCT